MPDTTPTPPRVWQRPDGTLVVHEDSPSYGRDVQWIAGQEQPPADAVELLSSAVPAGPAGEGGELVAGLARIQGALVRERADWGHLKSVRAGFNRVLDVLDEVARRPASPRVPVTAEAAGEGGDAR